MNRGRLAAQPPILSSNPVKRAVARRQIETAVRDFSIRLHLLADGEYVASDGLAALRVLLVVHELLAQTRQGDSPDARVIQGAISTLVQLQQRRWIWRRMDATALDAGLQRAAHHAKAALPDDLQLAWATADRQAAAAQHRGAP